MDVTFELLNETVKGFGRYLRDLLPGVMLTDTYVEQDFDLPAIYVTSGLATAKPRIGHRHKMVRVIVDMRVFGRTNIEVRQIVSAILLDIDVIETKMGPVRPRGVSTNYMGDTNATITCNVTYDLYSEDIPAPVMERLFYNERINSDEREKL